MSKKDIIISVVIGLAMLLGLNIADNMNRNEYIVTVTDKVVMNADDSIYLVFTEQNGSAKTFTNRDSLFNLKWQSSDLYEDIHKGSKYYIEAYGFRIPFLSRYENITYVQEIK